MKLIATLILAASMAACSSAPVLTEGEKAHEKSINIAKDVLKQQQEQRERMSFLAQQKR